MTFSKKKKIVMNLQAMLNTKRPRITKESKEKNILFLFAHPEAMLYDLKYGVNSGGSSYQHFSQISELQGA